MEASLRQVRDGCRKPSTSRGIADLAAAISSERRALPSADHKLTPVQAAKLILDLIPANEQGATEDVYMPNIFRTKYEYAHNRRSYDAIFQTVRLADGSEGIHTSDPLNVGATSLWFQLGKYTSTPGMVNLFLVRREIELQSKKVSSKDRAGLLQKLSTLQKQELEMHSVELQTEHFKAPRLNGTISKEVWQRLDYQRRSGKLLGPVTSDIQERLDSYIKVPTPPKKNWRPSSGTTLEDRFGNLIDDHRGGTKTTGIEVPRGENGCLFPGDEEGLLEGWSYWMCWYLLGRGLIRLWLWCNGRWICIICIETLYLTLQYLTLQYLIFVHHFAWTESNEVLHADTKAKSATNTLNGNERFVHVPCFHFGLYRYHNAPEQVRRVFDMSMWQVWLLVEIALDIVSKGDPARSRHDLCNEIIRQYNKRWAAAGCDKVMSAAKADMHHYFQTRSSGWTKDVKRIYKKKFDGEQIIVNASGVAQMYLRRRTENRNAYS